MKIENHDKNLDSVLVHKATPEYLQDLLKDKKQLQNFPNIFLHLEIILEKEITRVRERLFHLNESFRKSENELPEPAGNITTLQEKVFVPVKENPNYNFVGRLLGPRGLTAKQLEQDLECKIMVRGRGSLRDKKKEDMNRGKSNWEHLDEDLHVLVSVEDFENRAAIKLRRATETIRTFLEQGVRTPNGEDVLKRHQLMELAIINGTYRSEMHHENLISNAASPLSDEINLKDSEHEIAGSFLSYKDDCDPGDSWIRNKDRQHAHAQQLQQQQQQQQQHQQQLILQQQSMTVLNNQAAVAAAAAAQLFQPTASQSTNQLLARLQSQSSSITLNPALVSLPGSAATAAIQQPTGTSPLGLPNGGNLTPYLSNSMFSNVLGQTVGAVSPGAAVGIGLPLPTPLSASTPGIGLSALPFTVASGLQTAVSPNLMGCTANPTQDQVNAFAAALLAGGANSGATNANIQLANIRMNIPGSNLTKPSTSLYPMTTLPTSVVDSLNLFDYGAAISQAGQESGGFH
ncbi:protein quaking [Paragonimus westermani]|uniref:Protein quaking n=1 Tax=Paragonimus westermani TaxID=34504 RepID=A0A5J4NVX1_9TREM|nr:protein quaking [Paragonimus westermani]